MSEVGGGVVSTGRLPLFVYFAMPSRVDGLIACFAITSVGFYNQTMGTT